MSGYVIEIELAIVTPLGVGAGGSAIECSSLDG